MWEALLTGLVLGSLYCWLGTVAQLLEPVLISCGLILGEGLIIADVHMHARTQLHSSLRHFFLGWFKIGRKQASSVRSFLLFSLDQKHRAGRNGAFGMHGISPCWNSCKQGAIVHGK